MTSLAYAPMELKSDDEADDTGIVTKALDELRAANDERLAKLEKKSAERFDKIEQRLARPNLANDNGADAELETKAFISWVRSGGRDDEGLVTKTLSVTGGSTGGVLVPNDYRATIIEKIAEQSPVRQLADIQPMSGALLQMPRLVSGVVPAPVTELGTRAESEPTFELIDVKPFEMSVIVPISTQLLEDSAVNLASYISNHMARRFAMLENTWFVTGNGTTAAQGVLTSTEVASIDTTTSAVIKATDLIDLFYSIPSFYSARGAWLMKRDTIKAIRKLTDANGNFLWVPGLGSQPSTILGAPVYEAPDMPAATTGLTPIIFGDFSSGYMVADRVDYEAAIDTVTGWSTGITKLLARRRVGGRVILGEALTKLKIKA